MQTRLILRLARKLRATYKKRKSWRVAAEVCHVNDPHGDPSSGLAFQIAELGFMPSDDVVRRLIFDEAIERPKIDPLQLSIRDRQSILLALRKQRPLPCKVSMSTRRQFNDWLHTLALLQGLPS